MSIEALGLIDEVFTTAEQRLSDGFFVFLTKQCKQCKQSKQCVLLPGRYSSTVQRTTTVQRAAPSEIIHLH